MRVGRGAEFSAAARKNLGAGGKLGVGFQADYDFPVHVRRPALLAIAYASWPPGRPEPKPHGLDIAGRPARLTPRV
ncbi:hypothetical protein G6F66_015408 [Rhizopus arrhizus]|nr:hypothetical protein G6F66_015408 [Rhizopus arrhizus]